jgi:hypothetical protein
MQTTADRQSSSEDKARLLPQIFSCGTPADLVISVGTASSPDSSTSTNGCVSIGTKVFMHDGHPAGNPNPLSRWIGGTFDTVIDSALCSSTLESVLHLIPPMLEAMFIPARNNPANQLSIACLYDNTALSTINVTDPSEYITKDPETVTAFSVLHHPSAVAASVDTTHGVVRSSTNCPFLFISPIVNRLTKFDEETLPNLFAQTTAACLNAGVVLAWLLAGVDEILGGA